MQLVWESTWWRHELDQLNQYNNQLDWWMMEIQSSLPSLSHNLHASIHPTWVHQRGGASFGSFLWTLDSVFEAYRLQHMGSVGMNHHSRGKWLSPQFCTYTLSGSKCSFSVSVFVYRVQHTAYIPLASQSDVLPATLMVSSRSDLSMKSAWIQTHQTWLSAVSICALARAQAFWHDLVLWSVMVNIIGFSSWYFIVVVYFMIMGQSLILFD